MGSLICTGTGAGICLSSSSKFLLHEPCSSQKAKSLPGSEAANVGARLSFLMEGVGEGRVGAGQAPCFFPWENPSGIMYPK